MDTLLCKSVKKRHKIESMVLNFLFLLKKSLSDECVKIKVSEL